MHAAIKHQQGFRAWRLCLRLKLMTSTPASLGRPEHTEYWHDETRLFSRGFGLHAVVWCASLPSRKSSLLLCLEPCPAKLLNALIALGSYC